MGKARAKSVPAQIWDQHKELLHNLYITKGNTVGRIQDKMARKGFHASKHQYRDKFKIWKFKKNCPRLRPAVPVTEHGANGAIVLGVQPTPDAEVTTQQFADRNFEADVSITTREGVAQSEQVPEPESPFPQMAAGILRVDYPVEGNIAANEIFYLEASFDPQPTSIQNHSLVEAGQPQPNVGDYGHFDLQNIHPDDINESRQNGWREWDASAFDHVQESTAIWRALRGL